MAEIVQYSVEKILPALDLSERQGVFSLPEIKAIFKKIRAFEVTLLRSNRTQFDYLKYVNYLQSLIELVKRREIDSSKSNTLYKISKFTRDLLSRAVVKFPQDAKLWLTFINFCKDNYFRDTVSQIYTQMLQIHSTKPDIWILAAKWHFEEANSHNVARKLLQRGIRYNPESKLLWVQYFKMELMYCDLIRKRRQVLMRQFEGDSTQSTKGICRLRL